MNSHATTRLVELRPIAVALIRSSRAHRPGLGCPWSPSLAEMANLALGTSGMGLVVYSPASCFKT
jgi:hypothetical protein